MFKTGKCPKCESEKIITPSHRVKSDVVILGWFSEIPVSRYVCCECGYTEQWVKHEHDLELLWDKYGKKKNNKKKNEKK